MTDNSNNNLSRGHSGDFAEKIEKLRNHIIPASSVLILTHDYPDPDCLASAFGIYHLLSFWGIKSSVISFGGFVGRAENRAMIRFLNISTVPFVLTEVNDFERIILVDSFPGKGNVSLPKTTPVHAVIDHHPNDPLPGSTFFFDIRKDYGATSTIITKYLLEAHCPITPKLATALFYGIKTDTGDMRREVSPHDLECYKFLFDIMDHRLLSRIENPDRDVEFFKILHRAAESAVTYDTIGYTHLGTVTTPDYIAEMADLFHSLEKLEWMICSGLFKNQIFYSLRSKNNDNAGVNAERLAAILGGSGGGHSRVAAGRIPIESDNANKILEKFEYTMKEVFGITGVSEENLL
ncbi:MAG TPA: DHHA1 domain-containing protein [Chitinispirillaceae bacterium]|nr:DHHA1 domain-containing protein [Chitinispirillaceae bacterium]